MAELTDKEKELTERLTQLSKHLDTEITLIQDDSGKVNPHFDVNSCISKFIALLVYAGLNVPTQAMTPPYNRVNADIRYWEKKFEGK